MEYREVAFSGPVAGVRTFYTLRRANNTWHYGRPGAAQNYEDLACALGVSAGAMVRANQQHTARVRVVTRFDGGDGAVRPNPAYGHDGLVTNAPGIMLVTTEADCVPVYLVDPVARAIGMVHSGWKGTAGRIAANAVRIMEQEYGCRPTDILAVLGPHNCAGCYEVGAELKTEFAAEFSAEQIERFFIPRGSAENRLVNGVISLSGPADGGCSDGGAADSVGGGCSDNGGAANSVGDECAQPVASDSADSKRSSRGGESSRKFLLDLTAAIRMTLLEEGLTAEHVCDCGICTFTSDDLCSWRRDALLGDLMLTGIMMERD